MVVVLRGQILAMVGAGPSQLLKQQLACSNPLVATRRAAVAVAVTVTVAMAMAVAQQLVTAAEASARRRHHYRRRRRRRRRRAVLLPMESLSSLRSLTME